MHQQGGTTEPVLCVIPIRCFRQLVLSGGAHAQGFLSAALVVSSFHVLDKLGGEDGPERVVRTPQCSLAWKPIA